MYALTAIIAVIGAFLLIGAVIFGLLRNRNAKAPKAAAGNTSNTAPGSRR